MAPSRHVNTLHYGDNLDVLKRYIADESIDLVYLDPPFQSGRDYNVLFQEQDGAQAAAQIQAFEDTWEWDQGCAATFDDVVRGGGNVAVALEAFRQLLGGTPMLAYLTMMAPRLVELRRALKPTGALYLHCDPTASHYLKLLLDAVFGAESFLSEIVWKRSSAHSGSRRYSPVHDTILFYRKGSRHTWNPIHQPLPQETADAWYNNVEEKTGRRFNRADLTAPGTRTGPSGQPWRGTDPTAKGRHWAIPGFVRDLVGELPQDTQAALEALDRLGRIHWPKKAGGMPMLKRYLEEAKGIPALDVIGDIPPLNNVDAERLGYPTQKPVALLSRLLAAASNEGDVVLDPFCGCGTTIDAAQRLKREWRGIDITHLAVGLIKSRLLDVFGLEQNVDYQVVGEPRDLAGARQLAGEDRHQFEHWALGLVGARASAKGKGADKGIDGVLTFQEGGTGSPHQRVIISVKSGRVAPSMVRDLRGTVERERATIGVLVTLEEPSPGMSAEAASSGFYELNHYNRYPRIQILTVAELLAGGAIEMPPIRPGGTTLKRAPRAIALPHAPALPGLDPPPQGRSGRSRR